MNQSLQSTTSINDNVESSPPLQDEEQNNRNDAKTRLNHLLNDNNLQIVNVPPDGDCLLSAICFNVPEYTPLSLRLDLYNHIRQHSSLYRPFLTCSDSEYESELISLQNKGHWNSTMYDLVPFAISNMLKRNIIIYSSDYNYPIKHISPDMFMASGDDICISYLSIYGQEHYDALIPVNNTKSSNTLYCKEKLSPIHTCEKNKTKVSPKCKSRTRRFKRFIRTTNTTKKTNKDKTIVNLSNVELSTDQESILRLGPKFCPTPRTFNSDTFSQDINEGCRRVRLKEFFHDKKDQTSIPPKFYKPTGFNPPSGRNDALDEFCSSVKNTANVTPSEKYIKNNLNLPMRKALQQLRTLVFDRVIRISRADKGGAVVIQNVEDYISEAERQLNNPLHYSKLKSDPTVKIAKQSNLLVEDIYKKGHINENTKNWAIINPNLVRPQQFYHLPKIHKTLSNPPGRPIVSGSGGPTEKLSKLVDHWLQDTVKSLPSYVKDSTHMLNIIENWNTHNGPFPANTKLITIDVVGLYTNIPHNELETAIMHYLSTDNFNNDLPPVEEIIKIMNHILKNNTFNFEKQIYKQEFGTAMGTPMAPTISNLFMGWLEEKILTNSPVPIDCIFWKRYIDDIFLLWTGTDDQWDIFFNYINNIHDTIKFTNHVSSSEISFLDILIKLDGFIYTDLYTKNTDAHSYLHFSSCHPKHCKNNIPYSQILRLRRLCSKEEDFHLRCCELSGYFLERGYKKSVIEDAIKRAGHKCRTETLKYTHKIKNDRVPSVITHNPRNPPLRKILTDKHNVLLKDQRMAEAVPNVPVVGERNCKSLRDILMPSILPIKLNTVSPGSYKCDKECILCREHFVEQTTFSSDRTGETFTIRHHMTCLTENVIYLLFCSKCKCKQYVGESKNTMRIRFAGHRSDIKLKQKKTGKIPYIIEHFSSPGHSLQDMRALPIEQVCHNETAFRKSRERFWYTKLRTVYPEGLNELN